MVNLNDDKESSDTTENGNFVSSLIISPPSVGEASCSQALSVGPAKRKLVDVFDDIDEIDLDMPLKEAKIGKDK